MLVLAIRTDSPEAEVGLYEGSSRLAWERWTAHRELARTLHQKIGAVLEAKGREWKDIEGVVVFAGPGSFTGLRIGVAVANSLASQGAAIVGATGDKWLEDGLQFLEGGEDQKMVLPEYGAPVHITPQKK